MRTATTLVILLLAASPLATGLQAHAPRAVAAFEPTDAQLMLLLARLEHPDLIPMARPVVAPGTTLPFILDRVAQRAGATLSADDLAAFAALDPRVSAPLVSLFAAIDAAWDAYDAASAGLSADDINEIAKLRAEGALHSPRSAELAGEIDQETLIAAAIMLTDVVESIVVPQLQAAADNGAWPAAGAWDPVGVLRLGSTGNDIEPLDRIVQIDPRGDDVYQNNAGASTIVDPAFESNWNIVAPFGISIDLTGNDRYEDTRDSSVMGASVTGIGYGLLLDLAGNDEYTCDAECLASGLGTVRDHSGADYYHLANTIGVAAGFPLGIVRDDRGDDNYTIGYNAGGFSHFEGFLGLLWDRGGQDRYGSGIGAQDRRYGWGEQGGRGWLVDEGPESDTYTSAVTGPVQFRHGCNDCTWEMGTGLAGGPSGGQGNDNRLGLAHLIARQDPILRQLP